MWRCATSIDGGDAVGGAAGAGHDLRVAAGAVHAVHHGRHGSPPSSARDRITYDAPAWRCIRQAVLGL